MPRSRSRSWSPHGSSAHRKRIYSRSRSPRRRQHSSRSPHRPAESHHYRSRSPADRRARDSSPRRRDRSPSPYRRMRSRSRSPPRHSEGGRTEKKARGAGGGAFKWKDKPKPRDEESERGGSNGNMQRGYNRVLEPQGPQRDDVKSKFGDDYASRYTRPAPRPDGPDVESKFGPSAGGVDDAGEKKKSAKKKKTAGPKPTAEPMIIVHVNDRLGTKAAIPCLASDPIRLFKAQVAARIGRQPHEIMLKRQGERPFKDQLTLEDYSVSNGVQLDLEIDTGD